MDTAGLDFTEMGQQRREQLIGAANEASVFESSSESETCSSDELVNGAGVAMVFVVMHCNLHPDFRSPAGARSHRFSNEIRFESATSPQARKRVC